MLFADLAISQACPSSRFLEEMTATIPWSLFETQLAQAIQHKSGGRPPFSRLLLFKIHLLQTWFGLSDAQAEFQCRDRLSFRKFLGLSIDAQIPDSTTIENFRHELLETGLDTGLLTTLDAFFQEQGLLLKQGCMVDASYIKANCKPRKNRQDQSDPDADWGNKGFGYSATVNVDRETKLIRRVNTTSERPHDSQQLPAVIVGDEGHLYADSGYLGQEGMLRERGIVPHIIKRRVRGKKGEPTPALKLRDKYRNRLVSKLRAPVEHVFACWKTVFKVTVVAYRGLKRVNQQVHSMALGYNLRRFGYLCRG
jgi:transposase, IS5 family